jgi:hypothetical protein
VTLVLSYLAPSTAHPPHQQHATFSSVPTRSMRTTQQVIEHAAPLTLCK